jgi:hypothetical protein
MRQHCSRNISTTSPVSISAEGDHRLDPIVEPEVDSRAYAFAYLIQEPSQLPADFPVDENFEHALFLPQELVPRFQQPRYVPRLLLLTAEDLIVYSHPKCGPSKTRLPFMAVSHIELERFLTSCSLIVFTPGRVVHLPFHGRDQEYVATFGQYLKHRLATGKAPPKTASQAQQFGARLDYKFEQIERILGLAPAAVIARFFAPPQQLVRSRLFRDEVSWSFGTELVLTATELHRFSDDKDGYRQLYGFRASWAPLRNVAGLEWDEVFQSITIRLLGGLSLQLPVLQQWRNEANRFLEFASRQLRLAGSD